MLWMSVVCRPTCWYCVGIRIVSADALAACSLCDARCVDYRILHPITVACNQCLWMWKVAYGPKYLTYYSLKWQTPLRKLRFKTDLQIYFEVPFPTSITSKLNWSISRSKHGNEMYIIITLYKKLTFKDISCLALLYYLKW